MVMLDNTHQLGPNDPSTAIITSQHSSQHLDTIYLRATENYQRQHYLGLCSYEYFDVMYKS